MLYHFTLTDRRSWGGSPPVEFDFTGSPFQAAHVLYAWLGEAGASYISEKTGAPVILEPQSWTFLSLTEVMAQLDA